MGPFKGTLSPKLMEIPGGLWLLPRLRQLWRPHLLV